MLLSAWDAGGEERCALRLRGRGKSIRRLMERGEAEFLRSGFQGE